jgi:hypothetical protein
MAAFTEAQIDAMRGDQLRTELMAMGEEKKNLSQKRVGTLKALMKTKCGITATPAATPAVTAAVPPAGIPPPGNLLGGAAAPPAVTAAVPPAGIPLPGNPPGGATQEMKDLIQALMNCNMPKATAEQFITLQGLSSMGCIKGLSPDDMEATVGRHNKAMTGVNEAHKIFSTIVIKKLSTLAHSVRVWSLTGAEFNISNWTSDVQINQEMKELELFQLAEKNYTKPEPLKDLVKPDALLGDKPHEVFDIINTNIGQYLSANGSGSTLAYIISDPSAPTVNYPSHAQRLNQGLLKSGAAYLLDKATVYDVLEKWAQDEKCYDHIKPHKKNKDGRSAYLALKGIFLGASSVDSALIKAQTLISDGPDGLTYQGEVAGNAGLPWATYTGKLSNSYDQIESCSGDKHSQKSRVLRLIKGIKGDAAQQQVVTYACEHVKDTPKYYSDFHEAAAYLQGKIQGIYASAIANRAKNQTVKETSTEQHRDAGHGGGQGDRYRNPSGRGQGGRGHGGRGRGHGGRGRGGWENPMYDGNTEHKEINGVDVTNPFGKFESSVFFGDVRAYVLNRRRFLKSGPGHVDNGSHHNKHKQADVKAIAMAVAEVMSKRDGGGDNNPQHTKKPKGGEKDNDYQQMFVKE